MITTHEFSIYNGQHDFILKGKKVANVIAYELYEVFNDVEELVEHIIGYSDDRETYFEEKFNGIAGWAPGYNPVKAVTQILTQLY